MSDAAPAVTLRRAGPADLQAVAAVTVAAYEEFLEPEHDSYRAHLEDTARRADEGELWLAVDGAGDGADCGEGEVLGTVTVCPLGSPWREIARDDEGEFRMLAVAPAAQGRGVGRLLVELALRRSADEGQHHVVLSSLETMTAAHRLYASLGFTRLPERDWQPQPGVSLIAFQRGVAG